MSAPAVSDIEIALCKYIFTETIEGTQLNRCCGETQYAEHYLFEDGKSETSLCYEQCGWVRSNSCLCLCAVFCQFQLLLFLCAGREDIC